MIPFFFLTLLGVWVVAPHKYQCTAGSDSMRNRWKPSRIRQPPTHMHSTIDCVRKSTPSAMASSQTDSKVVEMPKKSGTISIQRLMRSRRTPRWCIKLAQKSTLFCDGQRGRRRFYEKGRKKQDEKRIADKKESRRSFMTSQENGARGKRWRPWAEPVFSFFPSSFCCCLQQLKGRALYGIFVTDRKQLVSHRLISKEGPTLEKRRRREKKTENKKIKQELNDSRRGLCADSQDKS